MNGIGFDLNVDLPFKYLEMMNGYIKVYLPSLEIQISKCVEKLLDQVYVLPICLYFEPLQLVLACYSIVLCKIKFPDIPGDRKWFNLIDQEIEFEVVSEIAELILTICKKKQPENAKANNKQINLFIYYNSFGGNQSQQAILDCEIESQWKQDEEINMKSEFTLKGNAPDQSFSEQLTSNDTLSNNDDERLFFEESYTNTKTKLKLSNEVV